MYRFLFLNTIVMVSLKLWVTIKDLGILKLKTSYFSKGKMWSSLLYDVTQHISQNSKISCFVPTCSITFFLSNYNLKLSHMDVCIILQKKHLMVSKHLYDCFQCYPFSITLLFPDEDRLHICIEVYPMDKSGVFQLLYK